MNSSVPLDWGEASIVFDEVESYAANLDLADSNEAQTRFDVIDRIIREILGWQHGQVKVEEDLPGQQRGYVDYVLRCADYLIVVEAKKIGAAFPSPTLQRKLKMKGSVLGKGEISDAIAQAKRYGHTKNADIVMITNGRCWCYFSMHDLDHESWANLLLSLNVRQ